MDIHPWTKYEIARLRDEERLLRAREASLVREARAANADDAEVDARSTTWFSWLRRREVPAEQPSVRARPV
jgi:hypothetical protein